MLSAVVICPFRFSIRVQYWSLIKHCQKLPSLLGKILHFQKKLILHFEHQVVELPFVRGVT